MVSSALSKLPRQQPVPPVSVAMVFRVLILILLLLLALVSILLVWREYHATLARSGERAENAAQTAAEHARWLVEANLQALRRIDDALGEGTDWWPMPADRDIEQIMEFLPEGASIWVADAQGNPVLASGSINPSMNIADRDYFAALAAGESVHISRLITGRATGRKVFVISRRIERDGRFVGVAASEIPVEVLSPFWLSLGLGPSSTVGLIRDDGWQIARHPVPQEAINMIDHVLFTEHLARSPSGHYRSQSSPIDAVTRVVGYHRAPGLPVIAVVGLSQDTLLSGFRRNMIILLSIGAPLAIALVLVSIWGLRWLRREEQARQELAEALERNRMLMREIHHRVKNNLQVVTSLINLQPGPTEAKAEMTRRIAAMASTYERIYQSGQLHRIDLHDHLPVVVDGIKDGYGADVSITYDLEPISVPSELVLPVTLIVSEVAGNAFKHAFPDGRRGNLTVKLRREGEGEAVLTVQDNGVGIEVGRKGRGLGMKLLEAFSRQLRGEHSLVVDGGTTFVLSFPLRAHETEVAA